MWGRRSHVKWGHGLTHTTLLETPEPEYRPSPASPNNPRIMSIVYQSTVAGYLARDFLEVVPLDVPAGSNDTEVTGF